LVIRTDRLGDVVLSTPVLTALKRSFPGSFVAMLVRPYTAQLLEHHPDLDMILLDEPISQPPRVLARQLRQHRFNAALLLHPTARLALACWLAGIPVRIGSGYRAYSWLFSRPVFEHRKNSGEHEVDLNLGLARAVGAHLDPVTFHLTIPLQAHQRVQRLLMQQGLSDQQPYLVLHPGSGGSALNWPPEYYAQLAAQVQQQQHLPVLVTGSAAEQELIDLVVTKAPQPLIRLDNQLTLIELAALLQRSRLVISNSTGPLHLAVALGTAVIGLYCPIAACSPKRWGPYGREDSVLVPEVPYCERCAREGCRYLNCMELISVEQVFSLAKKKLLQPHEPDGVGTG
jgi:heptosyltransferase III